MRRSTIRPGAKLISVKAAAEEYGLPTALLYDLIKRGELTAVQPPNVSASTSCELTWSKNLGAGK